MYSTCAGSSVQILQKKIPKYKIERVNIFDLKSERDRVRWNLNRQTHTCTIAVCTIWRWKFTLDFVVWQWRLFETKNEKPLV